MTFDFEDSSGVSVGALGDPFVAEEMDELSDLLYDRAEMLGIDPDDPEIMGGLITNLVKKIRDRIKKRKAKKSSASVTVSTDSGTASLGPGGFSYTSTGALNQRFVPSSAASSFDEMLKSPMVLLAGAGLLFLLLKKKGRKK